MTLLLWDQAILEYGVLNYTYEKAWELVSIQGKIKNPIYVVICPYIKIKVDKWLKHIHSIKSQMLSERLIFSCS